MQFREHGKMNLLRLFLLVAGCFLYQKSLFAEDQPLFSLGQQYSVDLVGEDSTNKSGPTTTKVNFDNGKLRIESGKPGMGMILIYRPDLKIIYQVMPSDKMVEEMTLDPATYR